MEPSTSISAANAIDIETNLSLSPGWKVTRFFVSASSNDVMLLVSC